MPRRLPALKCNGGGGIVSAAGGGEQGRKDLFFLQITPPPLSSPPSPAPSGKAQAWPRPRALQLLLDACQRLGLPSRSQDSPPAQWGRGGRRGRRSRSSGFFLERLSQAPAAAGRGRPCPACPQPWASPGLPWGAAAWAAPPGDEGMWGVRMPRRGTGSGTPCSWGERVEPLPRAAWHGAGTAGPGGSGSAPWGSFGGYPVCGCSWICGAVPRVTPSLDPRGCAECYPVCDSSRIRRAVLGATPCAPVARATGKALFCHVGTGVSRGFTLQPSHVPLRCPPSSLASPWPLQASACHDACGRRELVNLPALTFSPPPSVVRCLVAVPKAVGRGPPCQHPRPCGELQGSRAQP